MLDLSTLDTELDRLGRVPENVTSLARGFAGIALSGSSPQVLAQVDAELSALSNGEYHAPAPSRASSDALPSGVVRVEPLQRAAQAYEAWHEPEPAARIESAPPREPEAAVLTEETLVADSLAPVPHEDSGAFAQIPAARRSGSLTESQEIVLPDPIAREELSSESGELSLSGDDPSSGSFELPDSPTEPRIVTQDVDARGAAREQNETARAAITSREPLLPFDEVQDALEGSQPIAVSTRPTAGPSADLDRDPDAEFDALLSEATDPRGIPTGGTSGEVDTDDLLRGLEGEFDDDELAESLDDDVSHEADMLTRSLYEDSSDNTDILDRATLGALDAVAQSSDTRPDAEDDDGIDASLAALMGPDELDSGELEIIDDEPTLAPQPMPLMGSAREQNKASVATPTMPVPPKAPTAHPGLGNKAPPPPPPSSGVEKRPSFLGRLFTKREGE